MIGGFTTLLFCQLVGEIASHGLGLPVPGPVLGLILLAVGLHIGHRRRAPSPERLSSLGVVRVSDGLLGNLSLLFVPAGVGVIEQADLLRAQALALGVAVVLSTALTLAATVFVFVGVKRLRGAAADRPA